MVSLDFIFRIWKFDWGIILYVSEMIQLISIGNRDWVVLIFIGLFDVLVGVMEKMYFI